MHILTKFGADWSIFAECKPIQIYNIFYNSRADNSYHFDPIRSIIKLPRDLMVTYILTKFGAERLILVDARM